MEDEYFGGLVEKLRHGERHTEPSAPAAEAGEHRVHKVQWREPVDTRERRWIMLGGSWARRMRCAGAS